MPGLTLLLPRGVLLVRMPEIDLIHLLGLVMVAAEQLELVVIPKAYSGLLQRVKPSLVIERREAWELGPARALLVHLATRRKKKVG